MLLEDYLAFIATRPDEERWQLIDGMAILMPQPTLRHQCIATRASHVLNEHFRVSCLNFVALHRIGLIVPGADEFRPFADVTVLDGSSAGG